jgi:predicted transcriptional regulator of viral defense system
MRASDAYAQLEHMGRPVITTGEAADLWRTEPATASKMLARLAEPGLVRRLRAGIWKTGPGPVPVEVVLPVLTRPYPSYISLWSALFDHGMLDQIPRSVYATSLDRPQAIKTSVGEFRVHHVHPDLFGGFEGQTAIRAGRATPEKALFDTVYVLSTRSGTVTLPELELPSNFDDAEVGHWLELVPSRRLRSMAERNLTRILRTAERSAA